MDSQDCYLKEFINCICSGGGGLVGVKRFRTASIKRGDDLHEQLTNEQDAKYWCHINCVSSYTSKSHIKSSVSKQNGTDGPTPPAKQIRRSEQETFIFKEHCFLCGKVCEEVDPRHPNRWRPVSYCRTADRGSAQKTFKNVILDTCDSRNDEWGNRVRLRVHAAVSDLHAADAMYHRDCLQAFKSNTDQSQNKGEVSDDDAFCKVLHDMLANKSRMWNAVEIQELYKSHGG